MNRNKIRNIPKALYLMLSLFICSSPALSGSMSYYLEMNHLHPSFGIFKGGRLTDCVNVSGKEPSCKWSDYYLEFPSYSPWVSTIDPKVESREDYYQPPCTAGLNVPGWSPQAAGDVKWASGVAESNDWHQGSFFSGIQSSTGTWYLKTFPNESCATVLPKLGSSPYYGAINGLMTPQPAPPKFVMRIATIAVRNCGFLPSSCPDDFYFVINRNELSQAIKLGSWDDYINSCEMVGLDTTVNFGIVNISDITESQPLKKQNPFLIDCPSTSSVNPSVHLYLNSSKIKMGDGVSADLIVCDSNKNCGIDNYFSLSSLNSNSFFIETTLNVVRGVAKAQEYSGSTVLIAEFQ